MNPSANQRTPEEPLAGQRWSHIRRPATAAAVDLSFVLVFCLIGRSSHDEAWQLSGIAHTVWPFATGAIVGIGIVAAWGADPFRIVPSGLVMWFSTVALGMALRIVSGQGTAVSFCIVAGVIVAVFLLGWRAARLALQRRLG